MKKKIELNLNATFSITIPKDSQAQFENDKKRKEISLALNIPTDNITTNFDIYEDNFSKGGFKISEIKKETCSIEVSGIIVKELDDKFNKQLIDHLKTSKSVKVIISYISDSNLNYYYIDGDEDKTISAGEGRLI